MKCNDIAHWWQGGEKRVLWWPAERALFGTEALSHA